MAENDQVGNQDKRPLLRSELDLSFLTTNSVWGKGEVNNEFLAKTGKTLGFWVPVVDDANQPVLDEAGNVKYQFVTETEFLWNQLAFYTRDFRLGNLSKFDGEVAYCEYYSNLASDFLQLGMKHAFIVCLSRVAAKLELSQSSGGFFRRRTNTITQEHYQQDLEAKKVSLFGKAKTER